MKTFFGLVADQEAATAIEYGLIAALIAIAAIGSMTSLANPVVNAFNKIDNEMTKANS